MLVRLKSFVKSGAIVAVSTILGGIISYIQSAYLGRQLGPSLFGDYGAITSLLAIVTAACTAVLTVTAYFSSQLYAENSVSGLRKLQKRISHTILLIGLLIVGVFAILTTRMAAWFSIGDEKALLLSSISVLALFLLVVNRGVMQGTQKFFSLSLSNIGELAIKLVLAVLFVTLGYSLRGAVLSIVISTAISYLISLSLIKTLLRSVESENAKGIAVEEVGLTKKDVVKYAALTAVVTSLLITLFNLDIFLIKRYFDADLAGQYIAVSTVAKIIFYLTGPISTVMFPLIAEQRARGEKHYQTLLFALVLSGLASSVLMFLYYLFADKLINLLYGSSYQAAAHLLTSSGWIVVFIAFVNLMSNYFMSVRSFHFIWLMLLILLGELYYVTLNNGTILEVIHSMQVASGSLFILLFLYYVFMKRSQIVSLIKGQR